MKNFLLNGSPEGVSAPKSAFETIHGIVVRAKKKGDKVIVAKTELLQKLKEKKSMFLSIWERATDNVFVFKATECQETT